MPPLGAPAEQAQQAAEAAAREEQRRWLDAEAAKRAEQERAIVQAAERKVRRPQLPAVCSGLRRMGCRGTTGVVSLPVPSHGLGYVTWSCAG